jgi:hypothetical protein
MQQPFVSSMDAPVYRSLNLSEETKSMALHVEPFPTFRALGSDVIGKPKPSPDPSPKPSFPGSSRMKTIDMSSVTQSLESFGFSMPTSSPSKPQQKPVGECPPYFESNSSFLTNKPPKEAFESLIHVLQKRNIDHDYKPLIHKIKGVFYDSENSSPCTFNIKLFQAPLGTKKARYLLEFQRRYGCVVVFRKFYSQILQTLLVEGIAIPLVSSTSLSPASILAPGQIVLDKGTLDILMKGVGKSSSNLEHLREIIRLLAMLSKSSHNRAVLAESHGTTNLCDILARVLQLPDVEVRRCGATFLNNIAALEDLRGELISKLLAVMFKILSGSDCASAGFGDCGELMGRETQRQIIRALALMTETHAKQVCQDPLFSQYHKALTTLQTCSDSVLRADVIVTLQHLRCDV